MSDKPNARSVKFSNDERPGWSSERPRDENAPPRKVDVSVRCRVLAPTDRLRYSPGSLVVIVGPEAADPAGFAQRVIEERGAVFSDARVQQLLEGRVPADELESRASDLLHSAVVKRLQSGESVVLVLDGFDAQEREHYIRLAHPLRRPRHIILLDATPENVSEEERAPLAELRRQLDAGELGAEGFQTALRLGGQTITELKRIVFRPPPRDDD